MKKKLLQSYPARLFGLWLAVVLGFGSIMKKQKLLIVHLVLSLMLLGNSQVFSADVRDISPITDKILMIHFNDGHVDYTGIGEPNVRNFTMYHSVLNTTNADNKSNYTIKSLDDVNFGSAGKSPLNIGRKSKMVHVGNMFEASVPDYLRSHHVFIELPHALVPGRTYTVVLNNLASSSNEWTFKYEPINLRSETIHVNQVGFRPNAKKYAYLSQNMGSFNAGLHQNGGLNLSDYNNTSFRVVNATTGAIVYTGNITLQKGKTSPDSQNGSHFGPNRNFTNADVWQCDFSSFSTPGYYKIVVDRMGSSYPFEIKDDVYREAYYTAMRSLFFQRAGIHKELREHNNLVYPASHVNNKMYFRDSGRGEYPEPTDLSKEITGVWGWYFDAGDWDGILNYHARVPALLLMVYDMNPEKFSDGDVGNRWKRNEGDAWINEGSNGIPDILDEAKWLIDFMKRARERLQASGLGSGGVPSYVGVDAGAMDGKSSWTDTRKLNINRQDAGVTAMHAGLSGWLSACLVKAGRPQSEVDYYKNEAISAYTWAKNNGASGGDLQFGAAGLYRATGTSSYQSDYINAYNVGNWEYWAGPEWDQLAACLYAIIPNGHPNLNTSHRTTVRNSIKSGADNFWINDGMTRGFRATHIAGGQANFLGIFGTPRTLMQAVTHFVSNDTKYLDATQFAADYTLGGNQMNMVWMSGFGHHFDEQPFHPDSWYLIDYNDKVYTNPILPGYATYGTHHDCDFFGCGWQWEGDEDFSRSSAFPALTNSSYFPQSEGRFFNRVNIPGSEFTIHQNTLHAIFTYGYLSSSSASSFTPNQRPTLTLNLSQGQNVGYSCTPLRVTASNDTREVHYFYEWQLIGKSTDKANNFLLNWDISKYKLNVGQTVEITAVGYDDKGLNTLPSAAGKRNVTIVSGSSCGSSVAVTGVTVSPTTASISVGATQQLTATVAPSNATNKTVTWSSSNTSFATVNSSGLVTGVAVGTATITVTTQDGNKTATGVITVTNTTVPVTGVTVTPTTASINVGSTTALTATVQPSNATNKNVSWSTSASSVATVSSTGIVTGVSAGTATITVTTQDGAKTATATVTVTQTLNPQIISSIAGASESGNPAVNSYDGNTSTRWANDGTLPNAWIEYTLDKTYNLTSVNLLMFNGSSRTYPIEISVNGAVVWSGSTAMTSGVWTRSITATGNKVRIRMTGSNSNASDWFSINEITISGTVSSGTISVTGVTVSPTSASVSVGTTQQLTATVSPSNATNKNVTWSSSNTSIATVNSSGLVTGVAAGTATITATTQDGAKTATSAITVTGTPVACSGTGSIRLERYDGISGTAISNLTSASKFPGSPDFTSNPTSFEAPSNVADNYGLRMRGSLCPPTTGSYTFWIAGDDNVELWLSTDNNAANKTRIAYHSDWTNSREWNKYATQKSAVITLTAGTTYYIEALMKEGTGGDNLAVGWAKPGQATTAPSEVIPGSALIPAGATGSISVSGVTVSPTTASIGVGATRQLTATVSPSNATNKNVTWSSSNTSIATVNSSGLVTGVAAGSATITVTTQDGAKVATSAVTVTGSTVVNNCGSVNNSSFENNLTGWIGGASATISTNANTGTKAAVIGTAEGGLNYGTLIPLSGGQTFTFSLFARIEGGPSWAGVGVDYLNASGVEISEENIQVTATAYTKITVSKAAPANTANARIWSWKSGSVGRLYIDDVCLIKNGTGNGSARMAGVNSSLNYSMDAETIANAEVTAYPNPNHGDFINIVAPSSVKSFTAQLLNSHGQIINSTSYQGSSGVMSVSDVANGLYMLKVNYGVANRTVRVIIQK